MTDKSPEKPQRSWLSSEGLVVWVPVTLLVIFGFGLAIGRLDPPPPKSLRIATGSEQGAYFAYAKEYSRILARDGYTLEVVPTAGSVENLELLRSGKVTLALIQGGTTRDDDRDALEALATLFFEPLWVFYRADRQLDNLSDVDGWRIAIGAEGSGTRALALALLASNGIDAQDSELLALSSADAATALEQGTIDCAFFVSSASATYIADLLAAPEVKLLSFRRHRAYSIKHRYLSRVVLGEGSVDIADNLPAEDISLLAVAASLVARQDLHPDLIPLLLEAMATVHGPGGVFEQAGTFPSARFVELGLKPESERYLANGPPFLYRFFSFRVAALIDRLKILLLPLITLLIPLFKVGPPLYRWRIRSKIYRWYEDLKLIDEVLRDPPSAERLREHVETLVRLEHEVTGVTVPLSYMDEFYRLRSHIDLILAKLERLLAQDPAAKA